ncbi:MAG: hypothetical protein HRU18_03500 [Pseudoalteromonas sp.]|uniref:hypothetical protein n=1 Tax=Pseudoalteromonas sp. TaxID=53249 RepID=UPI001D880380|nr:hypothetical protein [Pseudoalteromonas sp.]NRA77251.1 hypothetical protein [Pseudoalteromonas sp.]
MNAYSEFRDVTITITPAPFALDGYKAILNKVGELETAYFKDNTLADITAGKTLLTGKTPYKVFLFDLTTDLAAGEYTFDFVEVAPNAESLVTAL